MVPGSVVPLIVAVVPQPARVVRPGALRFHRARVTEAFGIGGGADAERIEYENDRASHIRQVQNVCSV